MKEYNTRIKDRVSICIPTYNGEAHIKETIESVLNQNYSDIEIVICDDGSTDSTEEIVKNFGDSRIHFYKNDKNYGLGGNWNQTVSKSTGEFVKLLCQDDVLFDGAITAQAEALKNNRFKKDAIKNGKKYAKKSFLGRNIYAEPANLMYRGQYFDIFGGYDTSLKYTIDWDFAIKLSCVGNIYCTNKPIMSFRINSGSETSRLYSEENKLLIKDTMMLFDKHNEKLNLNCFNKAFFYTVTKSMMFVRGLILKLHN